MSLAMNQMGVLDNYHQQVHKYKRVVTICSGCCLRSPTAAVVLGADPYNFNTRSAGLTDEYAIIPFTESLYYWADEIVVMESWMLTEVTKRGLEWFPKRYERHPPIITLDIPDSFKYRDEGLVTMIRERYDASHTEDTDEQEND